MSDRSRRIQLRESTSEAHNALDRTIGPFDTPESYKAYLRGMAVFRHAVEAQLINAEWPSMLAGWTVERFSPLIEADLRDLKISMQRQEEDAATVPQGTETLFGILYVLEGSALGSRLLYKRAQALGYGASFGARHLAAQAAPSGRWQAFIALLESVDTIDMDQVAAASRATFSLAEKAFRQDIHEPA